MYKESIEFCFSRVFSLQIVSSQKARTKLQQFIDGVGDMLVYKLETPLIILAPSSVMTAKNDTEQLMVSFQTIRACL